MLSTTTWAQARAASTRAARVLHAAGLEPGDRCAVLARDAIEYVLLHAAASRAGVVLVPLNPRSAPAEWDLVTRDAGAQLLVCDAGFAGVCLPAMPVVGLDELFAPGPVLDDESGRAGGTELLRLYTGGTTRGTEGRVVVPGGGDLGDGADRPGPARGPAGRAGARCRPALARRRRLVGAGPGAELRGWELDAGPGR